MLVRLCNIRHCCAWQPGFCRPGHEVEGQGPQKSSTVESKEFSQLTLYSATQQHVMKAQPSSAGATGHRALPHFSQSPCCAQSSVWTRWGAGNTGQTQSCSAGQLLPASANQQARTDQNTLDPEGELTSTVSRRCF